MKNVLTVMRKELSRVFKDKKLIFTTFIMPGLLLFIIYSVMGNALGTMTEPSNKYEVYQIGITEEVQESIITSASLAEIEISFIETALENLEDLKEKIITEEVLLLVIFNDDQTIDYYYNGGSIQSSTVQSMISSLITASYSKIDINGVIYKENTPISLAKTDIGVNIIAMMLPMLIITFLFQGALAVGPESIAGDKERGTIATLLATPTKRREIALGKILSLSILSIISSLSSFIGVMLSLPKLMQSEQGLNFNTSTYVYVLLIIISSTLLIISLISIVSAYAKNIKEANTFAAPLMLISMAIGMVTMFSNGATSNTLLYFIPLFNTAQMLAAAFSGEIIITNLVITVIVNIVFAGVFTLVLTKMFNSERMMFTK